MRHGQPCVFRVSPLMDPAVDALLAGRGWSRIDETVVMAAPLSDATMPAGVAVAEARDAVWSEGYMRFNGVPPARQAIHDRMLAAILSRAGYAIASDEEGAPVAFGLGVVEANHVGLFDIVADPSRRRAGHGLRVVNGILAWGRGHGATQAYLQVVATNAPAIALYERLGFVEAYRYHYRLPA